MSGGVGDEAVVPVARHIGMGTEAERTGQGYRRLVSAAAPPIKSHAQTFSLCAKYGPRRTIQLGAIL